MSLPGAGYDCFQSTAQVAVVLYGMGPGGTDYPTTLNLAGPAVVQREAPVAVQQHDPHGFRIRPFRHNHADAVRQPLDAAALVRSHADVQRVTPAQQQVLLALRIAQGHLQRAAGAGFVQEPRHVASAVLQRAVDVAAAQAPGHHHAQAAALIQLEVDAPGDARPVRDFVGNQPALVANRFRVGGAQGHRAIV